MIAIMRVEFREEVGGGGGGGGNPLRFHLFHAHALIVDNTDEQLIGYSGGRPARMQSIN